MVPFIHVYLSLGYPQESSAFCNAFAIPFFPHSAVVSRQQIIPPDFLGLFSCLASHAQHSASLAHRVRTLGCSDMGEGIQRVGGHL